MLLISNLNDVLRGMKVWFSFQDILEFNDVQYFSPILKIFFIHIHDSG
jgi:hypothetical protein